MIRFCPNCETERGPHEVLCEGQVDGHPCGWDLSHVPFRDQGWRPTGPQLQPDVASVSQRCTNGHAVGSGDLLCAICNADVAEVATCEPVGAHPPPAVEETVIEGWRLGRRI